MDQITSLWILIPYSCYCQTATELESLNSSINLQLQSFESGNTAAIVSAVAIPVAVILTVTVVTVIVLAKNNRMTKMKTG